MSGGELHGDPDQEFRAQPPWRRPPQTRSHFIPPEIWLASAKNARGRRFRSAQFSDTISAAQIRVANPPKAFEQVVLKFAPNPISFPAGVHSSAIIDPSVKLGNRVSIQPHAVIEAAVSIGDDTVVGAGSYVGHESVIGASCLIYPNATIRERTRIGARVIIPAAP